MIVDPYRFGYPNNYALSLDGVSKYINTNGTRSSLATTTKGTWLVRMRPVDATPPTTEYIICFGDTNANEHLDLYMTSSGILYALARNAGALKWQLKTTASPFADNTGIYIALVTDAVSPKLYADSAFPAQSFSNENDKSFWFNAASNIDNGRIGNRSFGGSGETSHLNSLVDEVAYFDVDLSAAEIAEADDGESFINLSTHSKAANLIDHFRPGDDTRDNYNVDVTNEWRLYSGGTAGNTADTKDCEEADMVAP